MNTIKWHIYCLQNHHYNNNEITNKNNRKDDFNKEKEKKEIKVISLPENKKGKSIYEQMKERRAFTDHRSSDSDTSNKDQVRRRFKEQLEELPNVDNDDYNTMPIESFGEAMLRGMGYKG